MNQLLLVQLLHITMAPISSQFTSIINSMQLKCVTLPGWQMTSDDATILLNLLNLATICSHEVPFASALLTTGLPFSQLSSFAMSNTTLDDADIAALRGKTTLTSLHFASTHISDDAFAVFATLPALEILDVRNTQVPDVGLMYLTQLRCLFTIDASGTLDNARRLTRIL